jgi:GR25 family glycosyltransferase involved in LPS biosynthesis
MFSILGSELADIGFFINLDSSTERLDNVKKQIDQFQITDLHRFPALKDPLHQASATKSHCAALSSAINSGHDSLFIAEDDFQLYDNVFVTEPHINKKTSDYLKILSEHLLNTEWDVVCLGFNGKKRCIPISPHLSKNFKSTGAWGYLIKRRAAEFILNNFSYYRDRQAIDDLLPALTYYGFRSFVTNVQICHHAHGFVSTLQPSLGPIDYRQWITGNYYNTIWHYIKEIPADFDSALAQIYSGSDFNRNNIVRITNYNEDITGLIDFVDRHPEYYGTYIDLDTSKDRHIGYLISVEFHNLIHSWTDTPRITGLGSNIIEIQI